MKIEELYDLYLKSDGICTDSRNIFQNCLFFCLKGANFDGNKFAKEAIEKGAAFAVTEDENLANSRNCIVVDDVLQTLQKLACYHRKKLNIPVVGITGTNGKTTTKELINAVLSTKYKTACTKGNLNNHIGVPLTLLSIQRSDEIAIVEMGANHNGEIAFLCDIADPDFGIITNIGVAHIEGFGSKENIIVTKKALYEHVMKKGGTLFVNEKDEILSENIAYDKVVFYGADAERNLVKMDPYLNVKIGGKIVKTHLTGSYNIWNFACAAAVGTFFGVSEAQIVSAFENYVPSNHRSQVNVIADNTIISDYYNANLTSMTAALKNLAQLQHNHKVAILGDMLELGEISRAAHSEIAALAKQFNIETYFVGKEFSAVVSADKFENVAEANAYFAENPIKNALILIKGSNGIHLDKLSSILLK